MLGPFHVGRVIPTSREPIRYRDFGIWQESRKLAHPNEFEPVTAAFEGHLEVCFPLRLPALQKEKRRNVTRTYRGNTDWTLTAVTTSIFRPYQARRGGGQTTPHASGVGAGEVGNVTP